MTELMNSNRSDANVNLIFRGKTLHLELPAISITTAMWLDPGATPDPAGGQIGDTPN